MIEDNSGIKRNPIVETGQDNTGYFAARAEMQRITNLTDLEKFMNGIYDFYKANQFPPELVKKDLARLFTSHQERKIEIMVAIVREQTTIISGCKSLIDLADYEKSSELQNILIDSHLSRAESTALSKKIWDAIDDRRERLTQSAIFEIAAKYDPILVKVTDIPINELITELAKIGIDLDHAGSFLDQLYRYMDEKYASARQPN